MKVILLETKGYEGRDGSVLGPKHKGSLIKTVVIALYKSLPRTAGTRKENMSGQAVYHFFTWEWQQNCHFLSGNFFYVENLFGYKPLYICKSGTMMFRTLRDEIIIHPDSKSADRHTHQQECMLPSDAFSSKKPCLEIEARNVGSVSEPQYLLLEEKR